MKQAYCLHNATILTGLSLMHNCAIYIKDDKISVQQYVANTSKTLGAEVKVVNFIRFNVGE